jgi:hypothetical protein
VEQFRRRGTIFFQKKGLTLFFSRSNYAPFRGTICAPWNNLRTVEQFAHRGTIWRAKCVFLAKIFYDFLVVFMHKKPILFS